MNDALAVDAPRLLALRSELGYTDRGDRALPEEPEAVSAADQRRLTGDARRLADARDRERWDTARDAMVEALESLAVPSLASLESDLRTIARTIARIDRKVAA